MKRWIALIAPVLAAMPVAGQAQAGLIGMPRAIAAAERATGGKAMDADLDDRRGGALVYEVELVRDGRLQEVDVDARSGRIVARRAPRFAGYWARWIDGEELRQAARAGPLSRILSDLERRTGGRVLEVSFDVEAGQPRYEVEIATRAGVAEIHLDPRTGERLALVYDD